MVGSVDECWITDDWVIGGSFRATDVDVAKLDVAKLDVAKLDVAKLDGAGGFRP